MYGQINRLTTHPRRRDELAALMMAHDDPIPGCRSFVVANDPTNADSLWITEVWNSEQTWQASMEIPAIKSSIDKAMALVADWGQSVVTEPVGLIP